MADEPDDEPAGDDAEPVYDNFMDYPPPEYTAQPTADADDLETT